MEEMERFWLEEVIELSDNRTYILSPQGAGGLRVTDQVWDKSDQGRVDQAEPLKLEVMEVEDVKFIEDIKGIDRY